MQDIDFTDLTLKDALDLAILVEQEAEERYREFVHQLDLHHTPGASEFFGFMAENEARHGRELAERRQELFGDEERTVDRGMLFDVEAPAYEEARAFMSVQQALDVALEAEVKAWTFFDRALPKIENADVRELFEELRAEEVEHQRMVKAQMAKRPGDHLEHDPADHVDPPRAL